MIKVGQYKTVGDRLVVITEIFEDVAYGRFFDLQQIWIPAKWCVTSGICLTRVGNYYNLKTPTKPRMLAYIIDDEFNDRFGARVILYPEDKVVINKDWKRAPWLDEPVE